VSAEVQLLRDSYIDETYLNRIAVEGGTVRHVQHRPHPDRDAGSARLVAGGTNVLAVFCKNAEGGSEGTGVDKAWLTFNWW